MPVSGNSEPAVMRRYNYVGDEILSDFTWGFHLEFCVLIPVLNYMCVKCNQNLGIWEFWEFCVKNEQISKLPHKLSHLQLQ